MPQTGTPVQVNRSDAELLAAFSERREEAAFGELVHRYGPFVLATCRRLLDGEPDAEDAAQAVFLVLARKAADVRRVARLPDWLHHVAVQVALDARRARQRRQRHEQEAAKAMSAPRAANLSPVEQAELRRVLDEEMAALPEKQRLVLFHHYLLGRTQEETAALLGEKPGTVSMWLHRARERLKERLDRRGLALPVIAIAAFLSAEAGAAELPAHFVQSTVHAAAAVAAGVASAGSGTLSPLVAELTEGALKAMFYAKLKWAAVLLLAISAVGSGAGVVLYQARAEDGPQVQKQPAEPPAPAKPPPVPSNDISAPVKGDRVLAEFHYYPVVADLRTRPTDEARLAGQAKKHAEVLDGLKRAGLNILQVVRSTEGRTVGLDYRSLLLIEHRGAATLEALAQQPAFAGGIVFRDGVYAEGLPYPEARLKEKWAPNLMVGSKPAPYAFRAWGSGDIGRKKADADLYQSIPELKVDYTAPPASSGGSLGWAKLTPTGKLTLLEVFLRTKADFKFLQPGEGQADKPGPQIPPEGEKGLTWAARYLRNAEARLEARQYDGAISSAETALKYSPTDEQTARARQTIEESRRALSIGTPDGLSAFIKGRKLLLQVGIFALVPSSSAAKPTAEQFAAAQKETGQKVRKVLADAGLELLHIAEETKDGNHYFAKMVLDPKDKDAGEALKNAPWSRCGGVVFQEGEYQSGFSNSKDRNGNPSLPDKCGYKWYGPMDQAAKAADKEKWEKIEGLRLDYQGMWVRVYPQPGHTLLEVILLTGTNLYVDDGKPH